MFLLRFTDKFFVLPQNLAARQALGSRVKVLTVCQFILRCFILYATTLAATSNDSTCVQAQNLDAPPPPPVRRFSTDERAQLEATRDAKQRLRVNLDLAERRLLQIEQLTKAASFNQASVELGAYQALLDEALRITKQFSNNNVRGAFKQTEKTLRAQSYRLEAVRRTTPSEYAMFLDETIELARRVRTATLNGFFGSTVLQDGKSQPLEEDSSKNDSLKDNPSATKPNAPPQR